ncbi:AsmA family protein, partial [Neisseria animalis]
MPDRLFNANKHRLKLAAFGATAAVLLFVGMSASVYHIFSPERIQAWADQALQNTRRTIRFDSEIGRSWFPRPTLTLHNIIISRPDRRDAAIRIKRTQIGFAWQSLWQRQPIIEKWIIDHAEASIQQNQDRSWSIQDLAERRSAAVNRLIIANSRLQIQTPAGSQTIQALNLNLQAEKADGRRFQISGTLPHQTHPVTWQGQGVWKAEAQSWRIPDFRLQAQGRLQNQPLEIQAEAALQWQPQQHRLQAAHTIISADSSHQNLHLTAQIPQWELTPERLHINTLSSTLTAADQHSRWSATLTLDKANLRPKVATIAAAEIKGSHQTVYHQTQFTAAAPLLWQQGAGIETKPLKLTLRRQTLTEPTAPHFNTDLQGSLNIAPDQSWQGAFQGLFDRSPAVLNLQGRRNPAGIAQIEAAVALQKLNLTPYWQEISQANPEYPAWLAQPNAPQIAANLRIGSIQLPRAQMDNLTAQIRANSKELAVSPFQAELYGGKTNGTFSLSNTQPLRYRLQQHISGVHIRPLLQDTFNFRNLSGTAQAAIDLNAQNIRPISQTLSGSINLDITDGIWHGIDLHNILQSGKINQTAQNPQTPFTRFTYQSNIQNGIGSHQNTRLYAESLHALSSGHTDFARNKLNETLIIYNPRNPQAKPIPLQISGSLDNPALTLDYRRLTQGMHTPAEKQKAIAQTLKEQWQWLKPQQNTPKPPK